MRQLVCLPPQVALPRDLAVRHRPAAVVIVAVAVATVPITAATASAAAAAPPATAPALPSATERPLGCRAAP